jgi:hypothetical protein
VGGFLWERLQPRLGPVLWSNGFWMDEMLALEPENRLNGAFLIAAEAAPTILLFADRG